MQWSAGMSDRIGDWLGLSNRSCLAEKTKGRPKVMRKTEDLPRNGRKRCGDIGILPFKGYAAAVTSL